VKTSTTVIIGKTLNLIISIVAVGAGVGKMIYLLGLKNIINQTANTKEGTE
jgi:hypothetical protein